MVLQIMGWHDREVSEISLGSLARYSFNYVIDVDNTLLDLLGGLESKIKGYTRDLQETYNFDTEEIEKHVENAPEVFYEAFSVPRFFFGLKPTTLVPFLRRVLQSNKFNVLIYTNEKSGACFDAKVTVLKMLLSDLNFNLDSIAFLRYDGVSKLDVLGALDLNGTLYEIWDDHELGLKFGVVRGKVVRAIGYKYVYKTLEEFQRRKFDLRRVTVYAD